MLPFIQALPDDEPDEAQGKRKATLDESDIGAPPAQGVSARAAQKVELDLEDAPFLEEDEEAEQPVAAPARVEAPAVKETAPPAWKRYLSRKNLLLAFILLVLLAGIGVSLKMLVLDRPAEPVAEEKAEEAPAAPPAEEVKDADRTVHFEPFWVEKIDETGKVRFLQCRLALVTADPAVVREVNTKLLVLRDALYYYLRNKNYEFLADTKNMEALKKDLLSVLNKFIGADQIDTILIEEYLVK
jgi:flagellar FliL protein